MCIYIYICCYFVLLPVDSSRSIGLVYSILLVGSSHVQIMQVYIETPVCLFQLVDKWYKSKDEESFAMARMLIRDEGLLCGKHIIFY